jgi:hypothetical protein
MHEEDHKKDDADDEANDLSVHSGMGIPGPLAASVSGEDTIYDTLDQTRTQVSSFSAAASLHADIPGAHPFGNREFLITTSNEPGHTLSVKSLLPYLLHHAISIPALHRLWAEASENGTDATGRGQRGTDGGSQPE